MKLPNKYVMYLLMFMSIVALYAVINVGHENKKYWINKQKVFVSKIYLNRNLLFNEKSQEIVVDAFKLYKIDNTDMQSRFVIEKNPWFDTSECFVTEQYILIYLKSQIIKSDTVAVIDVTGEKFFFYNKLEEVQKNIFLRVLNDSLFFNRVKQ